MSLPSKAFTRCIIYFTLAILLLLLVGIAYALFTLRASLPVLDGEVIVAGMQAPVIIATDKLGIPDIRAASRQDAFRALGYVSARDRLFQMELARRNSAGRLAEILGPELVTTDTWHRIMGFNQVADSIVAQLSDEQRELLHAYAQGVNSYIEQAGTLPFEFLLLGYRPEPWRMQDSALVILGMYEILTWTEKDERMLSVMDKTLPPEVVAFLTPDTDGYTQSLLDNAPSRRPPTAIPVAALAALRDTMAPIAALAHVDDTLAGSNSWAVAASKTRAGRALLANDMHLDITVPNIWYRSQLNYDAVQLAGVTLPGVPALITGGNTHVAWGFTNIHGDFMDLVQLEVNPDDENQYKTPTGWREFAIRPETIKVKGAQEIALKVKTTLWGPVAQERLLGHPVAVRWVALDPTATNLDLVTMDTVKTVEEAVRVVNRAGAPQQNVMLADERGRVAWTTMGRIPLRRGFDGAVSRSWSDGERGWAGYIPPDELPRSIDPAAAYVVTANNRTVGREYPYVIGRNFSSGHRAYRIARRLRSMDSISEQDMLDIQLDTRVEFYDFYHKLALTLLTDRALADQPALRELREELQAWNGKADADSRGMGLLTQFRKRLTETVFTPFLSSCKQQDARFSYTWTYIDTPLQALLQARIPQLLPDPEHYSDWNDFLLGKLKESAQQLKQQYQVKSLRDLPWGRINVERIAHPFSGMSPLLASLLDMPKDEWPGCVICVRYAHKTDGASERMVVAPGHEREAILHMPGGQSGHPLSPNYRDEQPYWVAGLPLPFLAGPTRYTLVLTPEPGPLN